MIEHLKSNKNKYTWVVLPFNDLTIVSILEKIITFMTIIQYYIVIVYFANKGPYSQGYGFSSSHVWV